MKKFLLCLVVWGLWSISLEAEVLLKDDFKLFSPTGFPLAATDLLPKTPSETLAVKVVTGADNIAGGGKGSGVRILDNDPKFAILDYNFVSDAESQKDAIKISFDLAWNTVVKDDAEEAGSTLYFGVGPYQKDHVYLNSEAKRLVTASFYSAAKCSFRGGAKTKSKTFGLSARKAYRFTIYLNDYDDTTITTEAPNKEQLRLAPNTMVVYLGERQLCRLAVEKFMNAQKQMGRIGFSTTSAGMGLDFTIANLYVESLDDNLNEGK